jgi:hypothetical protein
VVCVKQARDDARHIAEAESIQDRNAKKISANGDKLRRQLAQESARLSAALHTEMQKKHEEIRTWFVLLEFHSAIMLGPEYAHTCNLGQMHG